MRPKAKPLPPTEYLRTRLDLVDGVLYWKERDDLSARANNSWNRKNAGKPAGSYDFKGYVIVRLDGRLYKAHRIVYAMVYGACSPDMDIDHINNVPDDNRPENLRLVTNAFNIRRKKRKYGTRPYDGLPQYRSSV